MSKVFDYVMNGGGETASLEAQLEHISGYLGVEIEENKKLREALEAAIKFYDDLGISQPWMAKAREVLKGK